MATYKKALKSIEVKTLGGTTVTVADTATEAKASAVIAEFEAKQTLHADGTLVPFHAIDSVKVTSTTADVTKEDAYGCDD